jgi:positive regulator of sigma E activity
MRHNLDRNRLVFSAVLLWFAWNIFLLVGVILNVEFVHSRAAGGQFTDFPTAIRVVYVLQLALVVYQAWIFKLIFHTEPIRLKWLPRFFVIVGILGILVNAASRSSNERWNVIPAGIITWAFWYYGVKKKKSGL